MRYAINLFHQHFPKTVKVDVSVSRHTVSIQHGIKKWEECQYECFGEILNGFQRPHLVATTMKWNITVTGKLWRTSAILFLKQVLELRVACFPTNLYVCRVSFCLLTDDSYRLVVIWWYFMTLSVSSLSDSQVLLSFTLVHNSINCFPFLACNLLNQ